MVAGESVKIICTVHRTFSWCVFSRGYNAIQKFTICDICSAYDLFPLLDVHQRFLGIK